MTNIASTPPSRPNLESQGVQDGSVGLEGLNLKVPTTSFLEDAQSFIWF